MIRIGLITVLACAAVMAAHAQAPDLSKLDVVERSIPDGPVALVAGNPISKEAFLEMYRRQLRELALLQDAGRVTEEQRVLTGLRSLYGLVQEELLHKTAKDRGITVSQEEAETALKEELAELAKRLTKEDGTPLAPGELTEAKVLERAGKTHDQAIQDLRRALMIEKVYEAISREKTADIPDSELRAFYDKNREQFRRPEGVTVKQIFLAPKPNPRDATPKQWAELEKQMENAIARIRAGESFDAVGKAVSDRPADVTISGPIETLPPFFVERIDKMQAGDMSAPFRSEYGYHMIQLVSMESGAEVSYDEAKDRIRAALLKIRADAAIADFCQPLMDDPEIVKVFVDLERTMNAQSGGRQARAGS